MILVQRGYTGGGEGLRGYKAMERLLMLSDLSLRESKTLEICWILSQMLCERPVVRNIYKAFYQTL